MHYLSFVWDPSAGIDLGFFMIRYYSLMFVIAFLLGWFIMKKIFNNEKIPIEQLDSLFIYMVVALLMGMRLGHVFFYQTELLWEDPVSVILPFSFQGGFHYTGFQGLASHGAAIGGIIAMFIYSRKVSKKPVLWILDRVVIACASGAVFVRIGNFLNSEIIGKPTGSDFGVIFKQLGENFPRHPAQLYESAGYVLVFFILWLIYWKTDKKKQRGFLFGAFFVLLFTVRFFVEFLKEAQVEGRGEWFLNTGQLLSIPLVLAGIYFIIQSSKKQSA